MRKNKVFFGWWIVAASAVISFWAGGIFYGTTAFFRPLVEEFGWSYLSVSLAGSLRSVEIGLLAPVLGLLADRFGPRPVVLLSGIGCGLGFLLLSRVQDLFLFYTAFIRALHRAERTGHRRDDQRGGQLVQAQRGPGHGSDGGGLRRRRAADPVSSSG